MVCERTARMIILCFVDGSFFLISTYGWDPGLLSFWSAQALVTIKNTNDSQFHKPNFHLA